MQEINSQANSWTSSVSYDTVTSVLEPVYSRRALNTRTCINGFGWQQEDPFCSVLWESLRTALAVSNAGEGGRECG